MKFRDENGGEWEEISCMELPWANGARIVRKLPPPNPMPEIRPGDMIFAFDKTSRFFVFQNNPARSALEVWFPDGAWRFVCRSVVLEIHRDGKLLWKKGE